MKCIINRAFFSAFPTIYAMTDILGYMANAEFRVMGDMHSRVSTVERQPIGCEFSTKT